MALDDYSLMSLKSGGGKSAIETETVEHYIYSMVSFKLIHTSYYICNILKISSIQSIIQKPLFDYITLPERGFCKMCRLTGWTLQVTTVVL